MKRENILVVDDNELNLKLVKLALASEGYEVRTAIDAMEALRVIGQERPHLILMDLQMPGMDGFELTRKLKSDSNTSDIIIIAVTSYAMKGDDEKAIASGCDGYMAKPIDTRKLPEQVAGYLKPAKKRKSHARANR